MLSFTYAFVRAELSAPHDYSPTKEQIKAEHYKLLDHTHESLKLYDFDFYVHPYDVCNKLGSKYASLPEYEVTKHHNFYNNLLSLQEGFFGCSITVYSLPFSCMQVCVLELLQIPEKNAAGQI